MGLPAKTTLSLTGTGIHAAYDTLSSAISAGRAKRARVEVKAVTLASTNATSFQGKLQGSLDGQNDWKDIYTLVSEGAATPTPAAEQSENITSNQTKGLVFEAATTFPFLRCGAKFTGGAGKAGETLTAVLRIFAS